MRKGSTKLYTGIKMTKASGEIQRPGRLRATVQTKIGFVKVNVKATVIGDKAEVRAVGIDEDYTLPSDLAHIIADPVLLLPDVVGAVENPVVTKLETSRRPGTRASSSPGSPARSIRTSFEDEAVRGYAQRIGERPVDIAIDENGLIVSVRIAGRIRLAGFEGCRAAARYLWIWRTGRDSLIRERMLLNHPARRRLGVAVDAAPHCLSDD